MMMKEGSAPFLSIHIQLKILLEFSRPGPWRWKVHAWFENVISTARVAFQSFGQYS
jgi:hypothetical protein